jgi:phosphoribosyl 1,2-cyclic phosphodiesterase
MEAVGVDLAEVSAAVCTHGHSDHVAGAAVLARRHGLDIHGTAPTLSRVPGNPPVERLRELPLSGRIRIGGLAIRTVPTVHDFPASVALVISDDESQLGVVTDLGQPTAALVKALSGVAALAVESNHDVEMLLNGPYPERLKRRVRSRVGHLSNVQTAQLVGKVLHADMQQVTLLHLSEQNNSPRLAIDTMRGVFLERGIAPELTVGEQDRPGERIRLRPNLPRQLELPWASASGRRSAAGSRSG